MTVSLCMIVRDEEMRIAACLGSVAGLVDEIIVVDTGSIDSTRSIARRYGARVHDFAWCDDFAAARNESVRLAKGDWILWLDADDRVEVPAQDALRVHLGTLPRENVGYLMKVLCPGPDGGPGDALMQVRLFRNHARIRWKYRVHEQIAPAVHATGGTIRETGIEIVHVGYRCSQEVERKLERNLRLLDLALETATLDGFLLQNRAETLLALGRPAEALVALNFCRGSARGEAAVRHALLEAMAYVGEGDLSGALGAVRIGRTRCGVNSDLHYLEARLLAAVGDLDAAGLCLRALLSGEGAYGRFGVRDQTVVGFRARHLLAEVLLCAGHEEAAEAEARRVTDDRPSFGYAWLTLGSALIARGNFKAVHALMDGFDTSTDATVGRTALEAEILSRIGEHDSALGLLDEGVQLRRGEPALLKARVRVLWESGERGDRLSSAIGAALAADPLCVFARRTERLLHQRGESRSTPFDTGAVT